MPHTVAQRDDVLIRSVDVHATHGIEVGDGIVVSEVVSNCWCSIVLMPETREPSVDIATSQLPSGTVQEEVVSVLHKPVYLLIISFEQHQHVIINHYLVLAIALSSADVDNAANQVNIFCLQFSDLNRTQAIAIHQFEDNLAGELIDFVWEHCFVEVILVYGHEEVLEFLFL